MVDAAQFYNNRVLTEYRKKENGELHVKFVEQLKNVITELAAYVKAYHMTGLSFNPKGGDFKSASSSSSAAPAASAKPSATTSAKSATSGPSRPAMSGDLLASIKAKQDNAAANLNKVTDDMKTKNRTDKVSVVPSTLQKTTAVATKDSKFNGTPRFELEKGVGEKWCVEYQKDNNNLQITETNLKQNVYVYRCLNSVINISGKVKNVAIDGCKKCAIIVDKVVSSIEFVNCESVKLQVSGSCPIVSVDKVDGFQLFLSKESLDTKLVTSKSSEMNINVPSNEDESDFKEHPVPEQFVTTYDPATGKFTTEVNSVFM